MYINSSTAASKVVYSETNRNNMDSMRKTTNFWMVLPSNSNMNSDPKNRPEKYTVRLRTPLKFDTIDQDTSAWEVALISFDYTNMFINVPDTVVRCWVGTASVRNPRVEEKPKAIRATYENMNQISRFLVQRMLQGDDADLSRENVVFGEFLIPAGMYQTVQDLGKVFCEKFDEVFKPHYGIALKMETDPTTKVVTFRNNNNETVRYFFTDQLIPRIFGCAATTPDWLRKLGAEGRLENRPALQQIYSMAEVGSDPPKMHHRFHTMYVYCDIIQYQVVGDTDAQLLAMIPISDGWAERKQYIASNPNYVSLCKSHVSDISIWIYDDRGNKMAFPERPDPINISLRFRKKQGLAW